MSFHFFRGSNSSREKLAALPKVIPAEKGSYNNMFLVREPVIRKIRDYLGVFPIRGGEVFQNPKTFVI